MEIINLVKEFVLFSLSKQPSDCTHACWAERAIKCSWRASGFEIIEGAVVGVMIWRKLESDRGHWGWSCRDIKM